MEFTGFGGVAPRALLYTAVLVQQWYCCAIRGLRNWYSSMKENGIRAGQGA